VSIVAATRGEAQDSTGVRAVRVIAYDVVRFRPAAGAPWVVGTVVAVSGDTLTAHLHSTRRASPASVRLSLDTVSAIERRVLRPGSRTMAAAEGLYWGTIAGGVFGWLAGATYGSLAGGTTWGEGAERGVLIGAPALGIGGAITLGSRHMRGDNGPESVRVEWVPVSVGSRADRSR
jgi:hypothetical protein